MADHMDYYGPQRFSEGNKAVIMFLKKVQGIAMAKELGLNSFYFLNLLWLVVADQQIVYLIIWLGTRRIWRRKQGCRLVSGEDQEVAVVIIKN